MQYRHLDKISNNQLDIYEMDHLMGKVFVEYLSPLKRNRIKTKMLKWQRELAE